MKVTESTLKTTIVSSEDEKNTYEVRKEYVGVKAKTAVIILLYPSVTARESFKNDDTLFQQEEILICRRIHC